MAGVGWGAGDSDLGGRARLRRTAAPRRPTETVASATVRDTVTGASSPASGGHFSPVVRPTRSPRLRPGARRGATPSSRVRDEPRSFLRPALGVEVVVVGRLQGAGWNGLFAGNSIHAGDAPRHYSAGPRLQPSGRS